MLKVGDTIECSDKEDAAEAAENLGLLGYDWDFEYERDGQKGIWIVIINEPEEGEDEDGRTF